MPEPTLTLMGSTVSTYSFLVGGALILSVMGAALHYRLHYTTWAAWDVLLAGVAGGLVLARTFHVLLNWAYFETHTAEITQLRAGGLNWHGAVLGALIGLMLLASVHGARVNGARLHGTHLHRVQLGVLLQALSMALPLLMFAAWWGCGAAHCAYGAEVNNLSEYPAWLVWEERDIYNTILPRYAAQPLGMAGALLLAVIAWRWCRVPGAFWRVLGLLALMMFVLGFLRGDYAVNVAGLRADQWLDLLFACGAFLRYSVSLRASSFHAAQTKQGTR